MNFASIVLFSYNTILNSFGQLVDKIGFGGFFRFAHALIGDFAFNPWQKVGDTCIDAG